MNGSRERVLRRIRDALKGAPPPSPSIPRGYRSSGTGERARILERFVDRVSDYDATVTRVGAEALPAAVARILEEREAGRMVLPSDLPEAWLDAVPEGAVERLRDGAGDRFLSRGSLASVHGVITGCSLAIAETGTIVLDGGVAQGRRALSLLPDYHLCVVRADQVVEIVPEGVAAMRDAVADRGAPLTLVSGPSATADIELERVQGVHGPRTLDVILVEGEG